MLKEQNWTQKTTHGIIVFIWNVQSRKIYRAQWSPACGKEKTGACFEWCVCVYGGGGLYSVLELDWGLLYNDLINILPTFEAYTLKERILSFVNRQQTRPHWGYLNVRSSGLQMWPCEIEGRKTKWQSWTSSRHHVGGWGWGVIYSSCPAGPRKSNRDESWYNSRKAVKGVTG